jgi:hypothetical protein
MSFILNGFFKLIGLDTTVDKLSNPFDVFMLAPILIPMFGVPALLDTDTESEILVIVVTVASKLLLTMMCNLYRRYKVCNNFSGGSIGKAGIDSIVALSVNYIISLFPFVGGNIMGELGFIATYALLNIINQINTTKFCNTPFTGNPSDQKLLGSSLVGLVLVIVSRYVLDFVQDSVGLG